jgi:hypothetical protein
MSFECANPEFHVPHKPYYLRKTAHALDEIRSVTNNLQHVPDQFKRLDFQLRLPYKANMIYGQFDAPANIAVVDEVNGLDGFFLKKTIHETVVDFIWFQKEHCQYLFWGSSKERVVDAMNRIRDRIITCVKNYNQESDAEEEAEEACPPSPLPFQSRPVWPDIAATPPPASEYTSSQNTRLFSERQPRAQVYGDRVRRSRSPSPQQRIFRSIGEAHYYDE